MDTRIDYKLIRENRKSIAIKVNRGEVIVKAPYLADLEYIEKIVYKHKRWIRKRVETSLNSEPEGELTPQEIKALKDEARDYFAKMVEKYSCITGLKCGRIKITSGKRRLGSCSKDGNICFSYRLMQYPESAREYVVLHELAHLLEMNHSPRFYKIIERYMPDYKERQKLLKRE